MKTPEITVGILSAKEINFTLLNDFKIVGRLVSGEQSVSVKEGKIEWENNLFDTLLFEPETMETHAFEIHDVVIGINFHWERKENQRFKGALKIIVENDKLTAINIISVEEYLISVISSEMSAAASLELLKAHAVISRSWLLAAPQPPKGGVQTAYPSFYSRLKELAVSNRHNPTEAEEFLWNNLKGKNLDGHKFRRQHIMGDCIADFVCLDKKLVIEVDGKYHNDPEIAEYDKLRKQLFNQYGFKVVRYTNEEVLFDIDNTLNKIKAELAHYNSPFRGLGGRLNEYIVWYERDAHVHFDVCADDHCQRYQGITRASTEKVRQAVEETRGEVLTFNNKICDARFSKCCGGVLEEFQNCWDDVKHPYLRKERDSKTDFYVPELWQEDESQQWIRTSPAAFCNTKDKKVLAQVLNNYDQETTDFYRWRVEYTQKEISELIFKRSGVDYGEILDLLPIQRGTSGRLVQLKIVGTKRTRIIGKELEIRRSLSNSHLYSSAFVVDKEFTDNTVIPAKFILTGAGWGHGVGLCQIGAAVMGEEGYSYNQILFHYYIGTTIDKLY